MSPLFSIIVPVYRSGPFLRDCLDSIRNQTLTDWECICINDGSPDDSGAILDEYARKDARFTAIHQENRGVSAARNAGLSLARGNWTVRKPPSQAGTSTSPRGKRGLSCATC